MNKILNVDKYMGKAMRTTSLKLMIANIYTLLAIAISIAVAIGFIAIFDMKPMTLGISAFMAILGPLSWSLIYKKSPDFQMEIHNHEKKKFDEKINELKNELKSSDLEEGLEQLQKIEQKFDTLFLVLSKRLRSGEITFSRYLKLAEQVFLSVMDNLQEIQIAKTAIAHINIEDLQKQKEAYSENEDMTETAQTINERIDVYESEVKRIYTLFAQNEKAMTVLDKTSTALAQTKTEKGLSEMTPDEAIKELETMASSTKNYAYSA